MFTSRLSERSSRSGAVAALAVLCAVVVFCASPMSGSAARKDKAAAGDDKPRTIKVDGKERRYWIHVPSGLDAQKPAPLVFALHGGSVDARSMIDGTGINAAADRENFIAVYPNAVDNRWNNGSMGGLAPKVKASDLPNDVHFIAALLDSLSSQYKIDAHRVYATGISMGGMMSYRLACELGDKIAAVAPVAGPLPVELKNCRPSRPVPVLAIHGTEDPMVPYAGGNTHVLWKKLGDVVGAEETVSMFARMNGCDEKPSVAAPIDRVPDDGTSVIRISYGGCKDGAAVELLKVEGGGHTWPSGNQYMPVKLVGRVTKEINVSAILQFFKDHPKP